MSNGAMADMSELLGRSSLGTRGARQLRARVPAEHADLVRKISDLLELADSGSVTALLDLAGLYRKLATIERQRSATGGLRLTP
ncbi:hypothetical protein GS917_26290 [Rhodococcus hoagii]|nr:hypothetical protein [Prescottella equi]